MLHALRYSSSSQRLHLSRGARETQSSGAAGSCRRSLEQFVPHCTRGSTRRAGRALVPSVPIHPSVSRPAPEVTSADGTGFSFTSRAAAWGFAGKAALRAQRGSGNLKMEPGGRRGFGFVCAQTVCASACVRAAGTYHRLSPSWSRRWGGSRVPTSGWWIQWDAFPSMHLPSHWCEAPHGPPPAARGACSGPVAAAIPDGDENRPTTAGGTGWRVPGPPARSGAGSC